MADHSNNIVNEDYLVQRLGMARILAEHTVLAIRSDDERVGTEEWLKRVSREELMSIGVEPFAADMIALFQSWLRETENADNITRGNGSLNGPLLLGGAVVGATQATAVGAAGLSAAGFGSAGVVGGSLAAAMQGPATVAGSWFALCQSAGATGAIAGPVGVAAGITAATIGLGAVALGLFVKHKIDEITRSNTENTNDKVQQTPSSVFAQVPLDVDFLMIGIQGLTMDDATRLLNRFREIHVHTINDFFCVSLDTMHELFDDVMTQYIEKIVEYQILLYSRWKNPEAQPATAHSEGQLTVAFLMRGIAGLTIDDATRLLNRFNAIHVLTISEFLVVSPAAMHRTLDEELGLYFGRIVDYQSRLRSNSTSSEGRNYENDVLQ